MNTPGPPAAPPSAAQDATGFGFGKVILLGEHAVVFGQPALAAGLSVGVRARATPGEGRVRIPAWNVEARVGDGSIVGAAIGKLLVRLGTDPLDLDLDTDLPARAGLGSSAAMAVAVARAASIRLGCSDADLRAAVNEAETMFHNTPSGIDAAASMSGGVGRFQRDEGWRPIALRNRIKLCVGLSGKPRDTANQIESVAHLIRRVPVARRLVETLGEVTEAGIAALTIGDIDGLGRLFDLAHGLLAGLRVSSPDLDAMVHAARAAGAIGAKLTGAGGGGAVIALAPSHTQDVLARWRALGYDGFLAVIGDG